jgi:3',5'-cyclic AMP phosphodiesterase CpdA
MSCSRRVKIAVVSDLHFCNQRTVGVGSELSHIVVQRIEEAGGKNPWADLFNLVCEEGLTADMLLCPGDITTHAAHGPLRMAWSGLVDLSKKLGAQSIACATGNHDVSSRYKDDSKNRLHDLDNPHDLFENLKQLKPDYPLHINGEETTSFAGRKRRVHYFGADFVVHEDENVRLIVFNSCARHITENSSYERGSIAHSALAELKFQLKEMTEHKINILLCHHHPIIHTQDGIGTYDVIHNGDLLLELLADHGDWIVVHGHKHDGKIRYAPGSAGSSPVVFSAASMGALLSVEELNRYRNQFYLIDIQLPDAGCPRGTTQVWNWHAGRGWKKAVDVNAGLTDGVGFGERAHPDVLAKMIFDQMNGGSRTWTQLNGEFDFLRYLTPEALHKVLQSLERKFSIVVLRDPHSGQVVEIGHGA